MFPQNENSNESLRALILENQRLLTENNQILRQMRRSNRLTMLFRVVWVTFIIVASYYTYTVYIKPNVTMVQNKLNEIEAVAGEVNEESGKVKSFFDAVMERIGSEAKRLDITDQTI
jgi:hypothetical protein